MDEREGMPVKPWLRVLLAASTLALTAPLGAKPPYIVYPYVQTGDSTTVTPAGIPWNDITHLTEAFGKVKATSPFASFAQPGTWSTMVATAHANNTRINISFGGAGVSDTTWSAATNATNLTTFVTEIMGVVSANDFDGVDIDWEFPEQQVAGDGTQFTSLIQALATQLHALTGYDGNPKTLTFYISPGAYICGVNWSAAATIVDYGVQGGYDYDANVGGTIYNGPVSLPTGVNFTDCFGTSRPLDSSSNISTIVSKGWAQNKTLLGCPFYIADGATDTVYNVISGGTFVSSATGTLEMESVYTYPSSGGSNYGVNDHDAFCAKINWAVGKMGMPGISMWELGNAYPATDAPVSSIWNVIGGNDSCVTVNTATPTFTPTFTYTPTHSPTPANTSTFTGTPTNTFTFDPTPIPTNSFTFTPTWTFSYTPTDTATPTFTPTGTLSPSPTSTFTNSPSPIGTFTNSPTPSFTATFTPNSTGTATFTAVVVLTSTPTPVTSPSGTPAQPVLYPNPVQGNEPLYLQVNLTATGSVDAKIYTIAFRKVNEFASPSLPPGVYSLPLQLTDNWGTTLANGLYYVVVTTPSGKNILKLLVIR